MMHIAAGRRGRWILGLLIVCLIVSNAFLWFATRDISSHVPDQPPTSDSRDGGSRGLYASYVPTKSDPELRDIPRTIATLKKLHVNRYYYLIWDRPMGQRPAIPRKTYSQRSWDQLPAFADAAKASGIEVIVYLVPPAESTPGTYLPFGWDYDKWFRATGRLAKAHPAIRGIALDDFGGATDQFNLVKGPKFSPERVRGLVMEAKSEAPWLRFFAVMYGQDFYSGTATFPRYRSVVDGVIYAYAGTNQPAHAPQNSVDAAGARATTRGILNQASCGSYGCLQANFEGSKVAELTGAREAVARTNVHVRDDNSRLRVTLADSGLPNQPVTRVMLRVDGRDVRRIALRRDHSQSVLDVPLARGSHEVELELTKPSGLRTVAVTLNRADVISSERSEGIAWSRWTLSAPQTVRWSTARSTPVTVLVYCAPFSREEHTPGAASPTYVEQVMAQVTPLLRMRELEGVVAYRPNINGVPNKPLLGSPASVAVIERYFREQLATASN